MKTIIFTTLLIIAAAYGVNTYVLEGEQSLTSIVSQEIKNFVIPPENPENDIFDVEPISETYKAEENEVYEVTNSQENTKIEEEISVPAKQEDIKIKHSNENISLSSKGALNCGEFDMKNLNYIQETETTELKNDQGEVTGSATSNSSMPDYGSVQQYQCIGDAFVNGCKDAEITVLTEDDTVMKQFTKNENGKCFVGVENSNEERFFNIICEVTEDIDFRKCIDNPDLPVCKDYINIIDSPATAFSTFAGMVYISPLFGSELLQCDMVSSETYE